MEKYVSLYEEVLKKEKYIDVEEKINAYKRRLINMYASDVFKDHNRYPTMNVDMVYAVIAMCLELKEQGLSDNEIIDFVNLVFERRRKSFRFLYKVLNNFPNSYQIAKKWNVSDHEKRVKDGSLIYDFFEVSNGKIEYCISKCMYIEMFEYYGIRSLCKIFCLTDEYAYAHISKNVKFIRHSDLCCGDCCHDEVIDRKHIK